MKKFERSWGNVNSLRPFLGISGPINIDDSTRQSLSIYGTVIYELEHAASWNQGRWGFHATDDYVLESWARGVQRALTGLISRVMCRIISSLITRLW